MNHWLPNKKIITMSIMVAAMGFVAYLAGIYVVGIKIGDIEEAHISKESFSTEERKREALEKIVEQHKSSIETLRSILIESGNEVGFIETIEKTGKDSGATFNISSINQGRLEEGAKKEDLILKIEAEGSWQQILNLTRNIESLPFGALITELNLDATSSGIWTARIGLVVFREIK
jgi:Tfp pilus assembly protein PilO